MTWGCSIREMTRVGPLALGALQRIGLVDLAHELRPDDRGARGELGARFLAWRRQNGVGVRGSFLWGRSLRARFEYYPR